MAGATNRRTAPWLKPGANSTGQGGSRIQEERPESVPGGLGKPDHLQMGRDSRREPLDQGPRPVKPRLHLLIPPRGLPVVGRGVTGDPHHGPHGLRVVIGDDTGRDPALASRMAVAMPVRPRPALQCTRIPGSAAASVVRAAATRPGRIRRL